MELWIPTEQQKRLDLKNDINLHAVKFRVTKINSFGCYQETKYILHTTGKSFLQIGKEKK